MIQWTNGNAIVTINPETGTRTIFCQDDTLELEFPFNIDIRVSTQCSFGMNERTGKAVCNFCHESAVTKGKFADFEKLQTILAPLPTGIELAIGCNQFTPELIQFFQWCKGKGFIVNITVNQGHLKRDEAIIKHLISETLIRGLGISFRERLKIENIQWLNEYPHTVWHVINGIDSLENVEKLSTHGVKKILVLGEKDFGFNSGKVKIFSENHQKWYREFYKLFHLFEVVSFDNLGAEQLKVKRFVQNWETVFQGERSLYIDAANGVFRPSSRSDIAVSVDEISVTHFFKTYCI